MTVGIVEIATFNPITGVSHFFRAIIVTALMGACSCDQPPSTHARTPPHTPPSHAGNPAGKN